MVEDRAGLAENRCFCPRHPVRRAARLSSRLEGPAGTASRHERADDRRRRGRMAHWRTRGSSRSCLSLRSIRITGIMGLPCAGPFVHGGGKTNAVFPCHLLAVAKQVDVAAGRLIGGRPTIGQPDADLLANHPRFVHRGEAAGLAPASLLPCQRELGITVPTVHRVDLDPRGTVADFHDTATAFAFPGHRTRLSSQLVRNSVRKTCRGLLWWFASC